MYTYTYIYAYKYSHIHVYVSDAHVPTTMQQAIECVLSIGAHHHAASYKGIYVH